MENSSSNFISTSEFLKQSWQIYKDRFSVLVGIFVVPAILSLILQLLSLNENRSAGVSALIIIITIAAIVISIWSQGASLLAIRDGSTLNVLDYYKQSKNKIWTLILSGILSGLIILGGMILLIVPGIIFSIWFMFTMFFVMYENKNAVESLKASKALVKGDTGKVLWRMVVLIFVYIAIYIVIIILSAIFQALGGAVGLAIVSAAVTALITPFGMIAVYVLYNFLKKQPRQASIPVSTT